MVVPWMTFKELLNNPYFLAHSRSMSFDEFMNFKQGNMSFDEYTSSFRILDKYTASISMSKDIRVAYVL